MDQRASNAVQAEDREARVFQEIERIKLRFEGAPIQVRFLPGLTAHRGALLSEREVGQPVLAGSFLRKREIVLDAELLENGVERARILVHEVFHFVWMRLGNLDRQSWSGMLETEREARARGELGWSSEWRKREAPEGQLWREYACESFCDTAAWIYAEIEDHDEFTLAERWRRKRRGWFEERINRRKSVRL